MNETEMKGKWNQLKGEVKRQWGKLTDDQIDEAEGNFDKMTGMIQETYGKNIEEAQREIAEFKRRHGIH